jgi:hypothetical protein
MPYFQDHYQISLRVVTEVKHVVPNLVETELAIKR